MSDDLTDLDATLAIFDYAVHKAAEESSRARKLERAFRRHRLSDRSDLREAIDALDSEDFHLELARHAAKELAELLDQERAEEAHLAHNIRLALGDDETRLRQSAT